LDDPLFPSTEVRRSAGGGFQPFGLKRAHWSNADAARRIFKRAFEIVSLPRFNPHSFRKTLARFGQEICRTPEMMKAWSQNLGHTRMLTTFTSYGQIDENRQGEIIRDLAEPIPDEEQLKDLFHTFVAEVKRRK
jgi:integrase